MTIKVKGCETLTWGFDGAANRKIELVETPETTEEGNDAFLKLKS